MRRGGDGLANSAKRLRDDALHVGIAAAETEEKSNEDVTGKRRKSVQGNSRCRVMLLSSSANF